MIKNIFMPLFVLALAVWFAGNSFAMCGMCGSGHSQGNAEAAEVSEKAASSAIDAGNKTCPVTGEPVDKTTTYEHKGKLYNFCCPGCIDEFKKDPEKYVNKLDEEAKEKVGQPHEMHSGHPH